MRWGWIYDMDFVATLCGFAKFGQEFGVFRAKLIRLRSREKLAVKHVAGLVKRLFHLVAPSRFLPAKPFPKAIISRHAIVDMTAILGTPAFLACAIGNELRPLDVIPCW